MGREKRLFLFSPWYFPSHFGLHVDDLARAFSDAGYEVTVVTVSRAAFELPYFDAFRETFDVVAGEWPRQLRLEVERLEERGAYNPRLVIRRDRTLLALRRQLEAGPCHLLHYFEMLLPWFNAETVASAVACSVLYAGNFITRIAGERDGAAIGSALANNIAKTMLQPYSLEAAGGEYRLRGVGSIFSETRELAAMLGGTNLSTPCFWTSRPIFAAPVLEAERRDIRKLWRIPENAKVLLYAGRPGKNVSALVPILRLVRARHGQAPVVLLLIGVSATEFAGWPGASEVAGAVWTAAFATRAQLFGTMQAVDLFVYPGLIDGYPKVVSEANLARLPVVAFVSPASGLREIATDGESALLVQAASAEASSAEENERFAEAVLRVLDGPALGAALVESAFHRAIEMDARRFVERIERFWREVRG